MRERIQKHNILIWYFATLVFTGGLLLLHFIWKSAGDYSVSFTQFGPLLATFLLIGMTKDKESSSKIWNGLCVHVQDLVYYVWAVIVSFALIGICGFVLSVISNSPYFAWKGNVIFYLINFIAMLFGVSVKKSVGVAICRQC